MIGGQIEKSVVQDGPVRFEGLGGLMAALGNSEFGRQLVGARGQTVARRPAPQNGTNAPIPVDQRAKTVEGDGVNLRRQRHGFLSKGYW